MCVLLSDIDIYHVPGQEPVGLVSVCGGSTGIGGWAYSLSGFSFCSPIVRVELVVSELKEVTWIS